ncbi:MAG TPA: AAA family ATPase [Xanthobacteraceae bacterium]|nr:AAA family ATPase [Xanthobacteraceae bacterium]
MNSNHTQKEILDYLESPASSGGLPVKRIDTHAASIFLSGTRALKVKRAVRFPYLDYSTLTLRKAACLAEIEINRRFAPELYIGLARVTRESDGSLRIGGQGEAVEWAVEMRRFDDGLTLDRFAENNEVPATMAEAVAARLAEVHRDAERQDAGAWIAALAGFFRQHRETFRKHPDLFDQRQADILLQDVTETLASTGELIRRRADAGLLVRGHGDLHLGNIALIKGAPVIFDAVEFDPLIAGGDILYDLAFFLMDLFVGRHRLAANAALNRYLAVSARSENLEGLRLLPLFLSTRSAIRAVVAVARFEQKRKPEDVATAQHYFHCACSLIAPSAPRLLAVGGLSGSGKSVLARSLAPFVLPAPGAVILRSDVKRKQILGLAEMARLDASAYSPEMSAKVYEAVLADAAKVIAAGHATIIDAVFGAPEERGAAARVAEKAGVPFQGIFLHADLDKRIERVERRTGDASDADRSVVLAQEARGAEAKEWIRVDSSGLPEETLDAALQATGLLRT